jgi:hypothetical protein
MQITAISTNQIRTLVPVKGWDSVEAALNAYNNGDINDSREAERQLSADLGKTDDGIGAALICLNGATAPDQKSDFITQMMKQAKSSIAEHDKWSGSYDYDGLNTAFFKTSVDIVRLDKQEDVYGISLQAAYVGKQPEVNLATFYAVERGIKQCSIDIEVEPTSADGFTFDFEVILGKLDDVLDTSHITGETIAAVMMAGDGWDTPIFTLPATDGYQITLQTGLVGNRMDRVGGKIVDRWSADGSCLLGNLLRDTTRADKNARKNPTLQITITKAGASHSGHTGVIWKTKEQEEIIALSNKIAAVLR